MSGTTLVSRYPGGSTSESWPAPLLHVQLPIELIAFIVGFNPIFKTWNFILNYIPSPIWWWKSSILGGALSEIFESQMHFWSHQERGKDTCGLHMENPLKMHDLLNLEKKWGTKLAVTIWKNWKHPNNEYNVYVNRYYVTCIYNILNIL